MQKTQSLLSSLSHHPLFSCPLLFSFSFNQHTFMKSSPHTNSTDTPLPPKHTSQSSTQSNYMHSFFPSFCFFLCHVQPCFFLFLLLFDLSPSNRKRDQKKMKEKTTRGACLNWHVQADVRADDGKVLAVPGKAREDAVGARKM